MPFINYTTKTIAVKIVYYGPGLGGKTTNIRYIYSHLDTESKGELISLETPTERTLFFDLLPIKAGMIREFTTHFHLLTVPGQVFYEASRKSVLKGVDGIVFVADSQIPLLNANLESFKGLKSNLLEQELDINLMPLVFQYNKRDLDNLIPLEKIDQLLNPLNVPYVESSAMNGVGVFETLSEIGKLVVPKVREKIFWEKVEMESADKMKVQEVAVQKDLFGTPIEKAYEVDEKETPVRFMKMKYRSQKDVEDELDKLAKESLE
jgi:signal recognition particle receptor subunit beta